MSDVNLDRLRDLAGHLRDALRQLRDIAQVSREAFLLDSRSINSAKYLLIVATETALEICNHIAARKSGRSPEDYPDCMTVLAEIGAINAPLRDRLVRMTRFRNLLVHLYAPVDDAEVYRVLRENLGDLDEYLASIGRFLGAELR